VCGGGDCGGVGGEVEVGGQGGVSVAGNLFNSATSTKRKRNRKRMPQITSDVRVNNEAKRKQVPHQRTR